MTMNPSLVLSAALLLGSPSLLPAAEGNPPPPPAAPNPSPAEMPDPVTRIRQIKGDAFALDDVLFNRATREIRFPAKVNMTRDQIEYIIVTEKGKTHESLLSTKTSPFILNIVMLLCRYQPSADDLIDFIEREGPDGGGGSPVPPAPTPPKNPFVDAPPAPDATPEKSPTTPPVPTPDASPAAPKKPADNLLQIFIRHKKDGKDIEVLLDDWILNTETKSSLSDEFWVYTGSDIVGGSFGAELEGSIVAIYVDRMAMFNNPIKGNDNDDIWTPFTERMPAVDTPVEVVIRPFVRKPAPEK